MVAARPRPSRRPKSLTLRDGALEELNATSAKCAHFGAGALPESPEVPSETSPLPLEALFPLDSGQVLSAVAYSISLRISTDRAAELDPKLAIFDESKIEGPAFHGGEDEIKALLQMMCGLGLDPNALVVASVFVDRLVLLLDRSSRASSDGRVIPVTTARAMILTMVLLASKFNFDVGVRMKHVRDNADARAALGPGLVKLFSKVEEHVLTLFDWQLRVSGSDYAAHYEKLVAMRRDATTQRGKGPWRRVMSVPVALDKLDFDQPAKAQAARE